MLSNCSRFASRATILFHKDFFSKFLFLICVMFKETNPFIFEKRALICVASFRLFVLFSLSFFLFCLLGKCRKYEIVLSFKFAFSSNGADLATFYMITGKWLSVLLERPIHSFVINRSVMK